MRSPRLSLLALVLPAALAAQHPPVRDPTLRSAIAAYDSLNFSQVIALGRLALRHRLTATERARAEQLLGFAFSATNQPDSAIAAFKECILLDPDRDLDPRRVSPRITGFFNAALGQVLVIRHLQVDTATFVGGAPGAGAPIRFTVTSLALVRTRAVRGDTSLLIDSTLVAGTMNLRWRATLPDGDPVPPGRWTIVVEAFGTGQYVFSASQEIVVAAAHVDTLPHLTALPGYRALPETEIPSQSGRPLGLALLYSGVAGVGAVALNNGDLGPAATREIGVAAAAALITGFVMTFRKPAPRPALGNIQYNRLLKEQLARRNADIARQNAERRRQVQLTVVPVPRNGT